MTVCWNLIKESLRHFIMYEAWQAWHTVQMMKCTVWLCHHNIFVFSTNREGWLGETAITEMMVGHTNCLNLIHQISFHPIQTAVCWHKQWHHFTTGLKIQPLTPTTLWQTETCNEQSANQWKDCGLEMNQYFWTLWYMCRTMATTKAYTLPNTEMLVSCTHVRRTDRRWMGGVPQESTSDRGSYVIYWAVKMALGCRRWQKEHILTL